MVWDKAKECLKNNLAKNIFDLWIALPRYEDEIHTKFIDWCRKQKHIRTIGYLEGNHEFYYLHVNGSVIWKPKIVVESDPQYFESSMVVSYWEVESRKEYEKKHGS